MQQDWDDSLDEAEALSNDEMDAESGQLYEHFRLVADKGQQLLRIDKFLVEHLPDTSRNRIQQAARAGFIHVGGRPVKSNYRVKPLDVVTMVLDRPPYDNTIVPEDIPLDIVYEDDELMVINKPAGMVVHPGHGNYHGTLVHAVAWHLRHMPGYDPNDPSLGLVHRIDKDTSGLLVIAKTANAKTKLGYSSSTKPPAGVTMPWCGAVLTSRRAALRATLPVIPKTVCRWPYFRPTQGWASRP